MEFPQILLFKCVIYETHAVPNTVSLHSAVFELVGWIEESSTVYVVAHVIKDCEVYQSHGINTEVDRKTDYLERPLHLATTDIGQSSIADRLIHNLQVSLITGSLSWRNAWFERGSSESLYTRTAPWRKVIQAIFIHNTLSLSLKLRNFVNNRISLNLDGRRVIHEKKVRAFLRSK